MESSSLSSSPKPHGHEEGSPSSIEDIFKINLIPSELFLKFRKELQGIRLALNLEFYNYETNEYRAKMVLKPLSPDRRWKFLCEPIHGDIGVMSKKIPLTKFLNLQADYVLPEVHGALGTTEPAFEWSSGRVQASLDRVEAILTHR